MSDPTDKEQAIACLQGAALAYAMNMNAGPAVDTTPEALRAAALRFAIEVLRGSEVPRVVEGVDFDPAIRYLIVYGQTITRIFK